MTSQLKTFRDAMKVTIAQADALEEIAREWCCSSDYSNVSERIVLGLRFAPGIEAAFNRLTENTKRQFEELQKLRSAAPHNVLETTNIIKQLKQDKANQQRRIAELEDQLSAFPEVRARRDAAEVRVAELLAHLETEQAAVSDRDKEIAKLEARVVDLKAEFHSMREARDKYLGKYETAQRIAADLVREQNLKPATWRREKVYALVDAFNEQNKDMLGTGFADDLFAAGQKVFDQVDDVFVAMRKVDGDVPVLGPNETTNGGYPDEDAPPAPPPVDPRVVRAIRAVLARVNRHPGLVVRNDENEELYAAMHALEKWHSVEVTRG